MELEDLTPLFASPEFQKMAEHLAKANLIDKCGKKGGLIIVIKMPDRTRIEDMQAMLKSIKDHGRN